LADDLLLAVPAFEGRRAVDVVEDELLLLLRGADDPAPASSRAVVKGCESVFPIICLAQMLSLLARWLFSYCYCDSLSMKPRRMTKLKFLLSAKNKKKQRLSTSYLFSGRQEKIREKEKIKEKQIYIGI
jgi:hypothetical protein